MALKRTQYWNSVTGTLRSGATGHGESLVDMESYLQPLEQARASRLNSWGVADGLRVSATANVAGVQIGTGAALDAAGRLVVLESGGTAIVDPAADPTAVVDVATVQVGSDGVALATADVSGEQLVTVTWREVQDGPANAPVLVHAPWLRLIPAAGFTDTGAQVVLATVQLDGAGAVTAMTPGPRRVVGAPTGRLEFRAPRTSATGVGVEQVPVAEVRVRDDGGLDVGLLAGTVDPAPSPALSIQGATGNVVLGGNGGRLGIGTTSPSAGLEIDRGAASDVALRIASSDPTWGAGLQMANSSATGRTFGTYSGGDGRWHFADVTGDADRLVIDPDGTVTTTGDVRVQGSLTVTGDSLLSSGGNPVKFTSAWQGFPDGFTNHAEISNDTGTYKTLMIVGNRSAGLGRRVSVWDRLEVNGTLVTAGDSLTGSNPIKFTSGWQAFPDAFTNHAEISNDTGTYKTLMIVGNRSAGLGRRVSVWDRLEVNGDAVVTGSVAASRFRTSFADVAERFPAAEHLEPGEVVGVDRAGGVRATRDAWDAAVVGIVSTAPGLMLNVDAEREGDPEVTVALCGRVPCRVTGENGSILPGDLLVSSSTRGHAMRAGASGGQARGSIIGKALSAMDSPTGLIDILVLMA